MKGEVNEMDYIDSGTRTHAMHFLTRKRLQTEQGWTWRARTYCGRTVTGTSGGCILAMIDCVACQRSVAAEDAR